MPHLQHKPFISVVIPTYRRRPQVEAAIRSIQEQSFADWELIVTDDEKPSGETWRYLQKFADADQRIHPIQHLTGQGQAANTNHGMGLARGEWIKLLHDDDRLAVHCLAQLAYVARAVDEQVVLITTGSCRPGKKCSLLGDKPLPAKVKQYRGSEALFGMYLQHEVGGAVPSAMMLRAKAFRNGAHFENEHVLPVALDSWFKVLLLSQGDLVHIDQPLMIKYKYSDVPSITTTVVQHELDREYELIRQLMLPLLDHHLKPPPLQVVQGQVRLIRAMHRLAIGKPLQGLTMTWSVTHPRAWWLALLWVMRKLRIGWCEHVKDIGSPLIKQP
jgi:glycosyltransferase involved in cell wall biosynthesis